MTQLGNFVWSIADQLRGVYKPAQYGSVVLPFTILRRMECVLDAHRDAIAPLIAATANEQALAAKLRKQYGLHFWNRSPHTLKSLLGDPENLADGLIDYVSKFSTDVADIFDKYGFTKTLTKLDENDRLYLVTQQFAEADMHPDTITNAGMGSVFEDLIRRFAEASNETAGEHFTPRDAIRLMVDLLLAPDATMLTQAGAVRTIYDPTAGTGGMLSVAEERIFELNPKARVTLSGQELNDETWAICKSDMIGQGQAVDAIKLGDLGRICVEVDEGVVTIGEVVDLVGELALAPLVNGVDLASALSDRGIDTLHNSETSLGVERRVNKEQQFISLHIVTSSGQMWLQVVKVRLKQEKTW